MLALGIGIFIVLVANLVFQIRVMRRFNKRKSAFFDGNEANPSEFNAFLDVAAQKFASAAHNSLKMSALGAAGVEAKLAKRAAIQIKDASLAGSNPLLAWLAEKVPALAQLAEHAPPELLASLTTKTTSQGNGEDNYKEQFGGF